MATISTLRVKGEKHPSRASNVIVPTVMEFELDLAKALAAKGSALAASDVIEVLTLPAGTVVLGGGAKVQEAADSTTVTVDVGIAGGAEFAAAADAKTTGYAADVAAIWKTNAAEAKVTVLLKTLTGTLTKGKLLVYVLTLDASFRNSKPGIAALKS